MPLQVDFDFQVDYYKSLGLTSTASQDEIKKAHRELIRQYHPDLCNASTENAVRFKEAQSAYDVLGDPHKKEVYDRVRSGGSRHAETIDPTLPGGLFGQFFVDKKKPQGDGVTVNDLFRLAKNLRVKGYWLTAYMGEGTHDLEYTIKVATSNAFCLLADEIDSAFSINTELTVEEMKPGYKPG